jgi:hypothetical protein
MLLLIVAAAASGSAQIAADMLVVVRYGIGNR